MTAVKVVLFSLLGLVGLVILLLAIPVYVSVTGHGDWRVRVRILGIPVTLFPRKSKPQQAKKSKPKSASKKDAAGKPSRADRLTAELREAFRRDGVAATAAYLKRLAALAGQTAGRMLRAVTVDRLHLRLVIAAEDPADTALQYGRLCAVVYPSVAVLEKAMRIRRRDVRVEPGFLQIAGQVQADIRLHTVPLRLLWALLIFVIRYTKETNDITSEPTKEVTEDGKSG